MIVEDEMLLALEMETELEDAGHEVLGVAGDFEQSLKLLSCAVPDLAFVDVNLRDGPTGLKVGKTLADRSVPFVFVTANVKMIPPHYLGAMGVLEKPYTSNGFSAVLSYLNSRICGDGPAVRPACFLAPAPIPNCPLTVDESAGHRSTDLQAPASNGDGTLESAGGRSTSVL